ncbi:MAG: NAD(P)-dependent oxidoreductase [Desulfobulbaceae bacterium]
MRLGFIGLGNLGRAICGRLLACGHELTVWNRTPAKAEGMAATLASSPAALAGQALVVFLCLFDSHAVRQALTGAAGLLAGEVVGKTIIDLTTNHFRDVREFHDLCAAAGVVYLEAPVLGSVVPASQGALTVLVSGNQHKFEQVRPLLADIGKQIFYLAQPTMATKMKLINNLALGSFMATLAEALALGEKAGIAREDILEILSVGGGSSLVLSAKKNKLLAEDFSPHFTCALMYKDLHCLQDLAYEQKKALFTGAVAKELFGLACEKGLGHDDFSAVYALLKSK